MYVPDAQWCQISQNAGVWSWEKFVAGPHKEKGDLCPQSPEFLEGFQQSTFKKLYCCLVTKLCLFVTSWTAAHQAPLFPTISQSLLQFVATESVMLSNHLILCHRLLLLPSVFPSVSVFSSKSALGIRWSKHWSFIFCISPSNEYSGLISFVIDWFDLLQSKGLSRVFSSTTNQKHQFFDTQPSLGSNSILNWRIIALQCCVGFLCTAVWIGHKYTQIPSLLTIPLPHPTLLHHHEALASASFVIGSFLLASISQVVIYVFLCYSPN